MEDHDHARDCEGRAVWSSAFINDLPDSSFAYIEPGGEKDEDGKTVPRSKRHFPHHDASGKIDLPHLRNALARAPQSPFGPKAMPHLERHAKAEKIGEREIRSYPLTELRVEAGDGEDAPPKITGYAAVFDQLSQPIMGQFREKIEPGAFGKALRGKPDIRALFNHSADYVLGRTSAKTLSLAQDERGLAVEIMPPDTVWARDLMASMQRGDIDQMSFAFSVGKDEWSQDLKERTIREVAQLFDISVVTFPAYPQTSAQARDMHEDYTEMLVMLDGMAFDQQFLMMMIEHETAGLTMAALAPAKAQDAAVRAYAAQVMTDHQDAIARLRELQAGLMSNARSEPRQEPEPIAGDAEDWRPKLALMRRRLDLLGLKHLA